MAVGTLIEVTGGRLAHGPDTTVVNGLAIDSREVAPGAAFVAFAGEHVDGRRYVPQAVRAGARAVLVTDPDEELISSVAELRRHDVAVVAIDDPLEAVQALASHHRERLHCPVLGVTGSTGKTTTKDFVAAVLARRLRVVATEGNRNNELGAPLTVMEAGAETEALIVEMAMRARGEIEQLGRIVRPTMGLVTNVGQTHIETLGSEEAIASAKGELVRSVPEKGVVFLNGDDAWTDTLAADTRAEVVRYGLGPACDVRAVDIEVDADGHPSLTLQTPSGSFETSLSVPGRHNAYNAAAAAAVASRLGLDREVIAEGLAEARVSPMRMEVFQSASGVTVINDAYNASPTSMRAGLAALDDIRVAGRRIAVLGDMAELGSLAELAHFELGEDVGRSRVDMLVTVGERAKRIADGARTSGLVDDVIHVCADGREASDVIRGLVREGDGVLVKASRVMGLEHVVEALVQADV